MTVSTVIEPSPKIGPIIRLKVCLFTIRPCHKMTAILCRKEHTPLLVVGRVDDAYTVQDAMFAQIFFINSKHIGRRRNIGFHRLVEIVSANVAQITSF